MRSKQGLIKRNRRLWENGSFFEPLEPRLLLSGSWATGVDAPAPDTDGTSQGMSGQATIASVEDAGIFGAAGCRQDQLQASGPVDVLADAPVLDTPAPVGSTGDGDAGDAQPEQALATAATTSREVVFVDAGIENHARLVEDILANRTADRELTVVVLDADRDGIAQISEALSGRQDLDAVHFITHGSAGVIQIGATRLTGDNLAPYAEAISGWRAALAPDADLLFYGCELAASESGRSLLNHLGSLTGADVAASDDLTGNAWRGGDWELEYTAGSIETDVAHGASMGERWNGLLAEITVTTTADTLDGDANCYNVAALALDKGADGEVSLREAIKAANNAPDADTIYLGAGTYRITTLAGDADESGDFDIYENISIVGLSPTLSIVDGNANDRVFEVHDTSGDISVAFSNLTIENGANGTDGGGLMINGSLNTPDVFLGNVWLTGNDATNAGDAGGAVYNQGNLTIENSLISGNSAVDGGGGVFNAAGGNLTMTNVTVSGNSSSTGEGGGIVNLGTATLRHVTIANNTTGSDGGGIYHGGGALTDIANSIIAGNTAASGTDILGIVGSSGYNIIGDTTGAGGFVASDYEDVDPLLGPLADNGGSLMTHALLATSPAIDPVGLSGAPSLDQRGFVRDAAPDMGAFEVGASAAYYLDRFDTDASFAGDDGTLSWTNDWQEVGEADGALGGNARVQDGFAGDGGGNVEMYLKNDKGLWREADLSGASTAVLSFDYARISFEAGDHLVVYIQTAGGTGGVVVGDAPGTWDEIGRFSGVADDAAYLSTAIDISAYIAGDTRILFVSESTGSNNDEICVDNVRIDLNAALPVNSEPMPDAGGPYTLSVGGTLNLDGSASTDADGTIVNWSWDIGNDGIYEKAGMTVSYTWAELSALGVGGAGTIDVALRVTDNDGGQATQVFQVVIDNNPPVAATDAFTVAEGSTTTLDLAANDSDADDGLDLASIVIVSGPSNGSIVVNADGTVDYTHDGGETVSDAFTYTIDDLSGHTSNTVTVNLTVSPVNDPGVVTIDSTAPIAGQTLTATVADAEGASGAIAYQWYRDGAIIDGATASTYTTGQDDVGATITVTATYTDDQGNVENLTSAAAVVRTANSPEPPADDATTPTAGDTQTGDSGQPEPVPAPAENESETVVEPESPAPAVPVEAVLAAVPNPDKDGTPPPRRPSPTRQDALIRVNRQRVTAQPASTATETPETDAAETTASPDRSATDDPGPERADRLVREANLRAARAYLNMAHSLDEMKGEMANDIAFHKMVLGSAITVSTGLSVGYVVWLLRGGMLLSTLLSSLPAWQILDPLPILARRNDDDRLEDDESLESILERDPEPPAPDGKTEAATAGDAERGDRP